MTNLVTSAKTVVAWAEALQPLVTICAIFLGGWWTWKLFIQQRQRYPRANTSHSVTCFDATPSQMAVHVTVCVSNVGSVLVTLSEAHVRLQQLLPVPGEVLQRLEAGEDPVDDGESEVDWPVIGECDLPLDGYEIEPSESDEFHFDFFIPRSVHTFEVYSHLKNVTKTERHIGWNHTTVETTHSGTPPRAAN